MPPPTGQRGSPRRREPPNRIRLSAPGDGCPVARLTDPRRGATARATTGSRTSPGDEGNLLDELKAVRERAERGRESQFLAEIRERGVRGPEETIKALQGENRVYHVAALWDLDGEVRWSDTDGLAIMDTTQEESPYSGEPTRVRPLTDVLVELSGERGARLDFMRDEFGGVAGLVRF